MESFGTRLAGAQVVLEVVRTTSAEVCFDSYNDALLFSNVFFRTERLEYIGRKSIRNGGVAGS